jgi:hypothetical protein
MHRLQQFLAGSILPDLSSLEQFVKKGEGAGAAMIRSRLTENLLWLHLGAELGAFPGEASSDVYTAHFIPLFESLISRGKRNAMLQNWIYVAHSVESEALIFSFPRFAAVLVEKAMRGEDVFGAERSEFRDADSLRPAFQALLIMASNLATCRDITDFIYHVNFVDDGAWVKEWEQDFGPREVLAAQTQRGGPSAAHICAGFLQLWGYATKLQDFFGNLEGRSTLSQTDLFKFRQRAREIQSWILNLRSAQTSSRFDEIRRKVNQGLDADVGEGKIIAPDSARFIQESMDSAFEFWFTAAPALEPSEA